MHSQSFIGTDGNIAAAIIEKENKHVEAIVLEDGTPVTHFRCNRVWVWVDENKVVIQTPMVG